MIDRQTLICFEHIHNHSNYKYSSPFSKSGIKVTTGFRIITHSSKGVKLECLIEAIDLKSLVDEVICIQTVFFLSGMSEKRLDFLLVLSTPPYPAGKSLG